MTEVMMILTGPWVSDGVFNIEQFDPGPFMEMLNIHGLSWEERIL